MKYFCDFFYYLWCLWACSKEPASSINILNFLSFVSCLPLPHEWKFSVSMTFCWDWAAFDRGRFIIFVVFPVDLKHSVKLRAVICRYFLLISNSQWNSEPKSFLLHDRIIALSFSAAIGVLLVVLGCALEEYGWVKRCWKFLEHYL